MMVAVAAPRLSGGGADRRSSGTILLVEDDTQVRTLMQGNSPARRISGSRRPGPSRSGLESDRFAGEIDLLVTDVV